MAVYKDFITTFEIWESCLDLPESILLEHLNGVLSFLHRANLNLWIYVMYSRILLQILKSFHQNNVSRLT